MIAKWVESVYKNECRKIRIPNFLIWNQTRCHCAMPFMPNTTGPRKPDIMVSVIFIYVFCARFVFCVGPVVSNYCISMHARYIVACIFQGQFLVNNLYVY